MKNGADKAKKAEIANCIDFSFLDIKLAIIITPHDVIMTLKKG